MVPTNCYTFVRSDLVGTLYVLYYVVQLPTSHWLRYFGSTEYIYAVVKPFQPCTLSLVVSKISAYHMFHPPIPLGTRLRLCEHQTSDPHSIQYLTYLDM